MLTDLLDPRTLMLAAVVVFLATFSALPLAASTCDETIFGGTLLGETRLLTQTSRLDGDSGSIEYRTFGWYRMHDGRLMLVSCETTWTPL